MKEVKTPESDFLIKEETRMVMQAVKYLPIKQQVVIVLFYYQDLSILEIAQVLHIKEGTVKSRLYKARENLRGYLSYCIMEDHEKEMNAWIE
ncbi:RNA polymerase sigma factor [Bacillus cereus]|nr:sigma-70 family RNA polymerase sigma factor [Bacillus cereus]WJE26193.1 sigma-70 family RNA polymerase sigma factor [Bacillus cereus]